MPGWHFKFLRFNAAPRAPDDLPPPGREITGPVIDSIATIAQLQSCFSDIAVDAPVAHTVSLPEK